MKEINNIEIIQKIFPKLNREFINVYIISRTKDGNETSHVHNIYYIYSLEELMEKYDMMKAIARHCNGRIYINLSPKSIEKHHKRVAQRLVELALNGDYINPRKIADSEAGKMKNSIWVIDADHKDDIEGVRGCLRSMVEWYTEVPTVNGAHFLVPPFRADYIEEYFPCAEVKRDCMGTLLFYAGKPTK